MKTSLKRFRHFLLLGISSFVIFSCLISIVAPNQKTLAACPAGTTQTGIGCIGQGTNLGGGNTGQPTPTGCPTNELSIAGVCTPYRNPDANGKCPAGYTFAGNLSACISNGGATRPTDPSNNGTTAAGCPGSTAPADFNCSTIPAGCPGSTGLIDRNAGNADLSCKYAPTDQNWTCPAASCKFDSGPTVTKGQSYAAAVTAADGSGADAADPELQCNTVNTRLDWIICPVIKIVNSAISGLDSLLINMLSVDPKIVDKNDGTAGKNYYTAWQSFRTIALAILVIAALLMLIGQALGFEVLDAYTLKKVMPRLLIAIIGIALSWEIIGWFVVLTNDLGLGVRTLIYAPFKGVSGGVINLGSTGVVLSLLSLPVMAGMGIFALLLYGASAFMALLIGFAVLVVRQIVIVVLILVAPIAIACYVLPNTQNLWKLWHESFSKALLMFPIIMAFLAAGRVFAMVSTGPGTDPARQVVGFFAYILPYFLIPATFKFAGGALRTIGGFANDRSRGLFDRAKKARGANYARRGQAFKSGSLYQDRGVGKVLNTSGRHLGAGVSHGRKFGFGQKGRAAMATQEQARVQETLKNNAMLGELQNNDDANAVLAYSGGSASGGRAALNDLKKGWHRDARAKYDAARAAHSSGQISAAEFDVEQQAFDKSGAKIEQRGEDAYNAAATVGFRRDNAAAALQTVARNKSRAVGAGDIDTVNAGIKRLHGDNTMAGKQAAYSYQYFSREAGRGDLGGNFMLDRNKVTQQAEARISAGEFNHITHADPAEQQRMRLKEAETIVASDLTAVDGMGRTGVSALVNGHTNQLKQNAAALTRMFRYGTDQDKTLAAVRMVELQKNMSYGSGDNQAIINQLMQDVGVKYSSTGEAVENQIADRLQARLATPTVITGTELTRAARTYDREEVQRTQAGAINP